MISNELLRSYRARLAIAVAASMVIHAGLLAVLVLNAPSGGDVAGRDITLMSLSDDADDDFVNPLELAFGETNDGAAPEIASDGPASNPGMSREAPPEMPAIPSAPAGTDDGTEINLAMAETVATPAVVRQPAQRGLVLREGGSTAARNRGVVYRPASAGAREAEGGRGTDLDGLDGLLPAIGGGAGYCPPGSGGGSYGLPGGIGRPRIGGLPTVGGLTGVSQPQIGRAGGSFRPPGIGSPIGGRSGRFGGR